MKNLMILFLTLTNWVSYAQNFEKIDAYLQQTLSASATCGFSVVVVKNNQVLFSKGYGVEVVGNIKPMTSQSVSAIGSLTKAFTATAIMQLAEQGKLRLEDLVIKYLPWFRTVNKEESDKITIQMLLNNTSGLDGYTSKSADVSDKAIEKLVRSLSATYLKQSPGTSYQYSNVGFSVAGLVVSKVSGIPFSTYLKEHIFKPLQMNHSSTNPDEFKQLNTLYGHYFGIDTWFAVQPTLESGEYIPAGSHCRSTALEMGNWLIALLNQGEYQNTQILSLQSLQKMWTENISFPGFSQEEGGNGKNSSYGLGWMISEIDGRKMIHHGGSTGTMSAYMMIDLEQKTAVCLLVNVDYFQTNKYQYAPLHHITNNILHLANDENITQFGIPTQKDPTLNTYQLPKSLYSKYIGKYSVAHTGLIPMDKLEIYLDKKGALTAKGTQGNQVLMDFHLDFYNPSGAVARYMGANHTLQFKMDLKGNITGVYVVGGEYKKPLESIQKQYQQVNSPDQKATLMLPTSWGYQWQGEKLFAYHKHDKNMFLYAKQLTQPTSLDKILKIYLPDYQITRQGIVQTEERGKYFWQEQSFMTVKGSQKYQHWVLLNRQNFLIILTTPYGNLSQETQKVLFYLMEHFEGKS
jgi:CubicO group peptidase (beta-lactamase class C family)